MHTQKSPQVDQLDQLIDAQEKLAAAAGDPEDAADAANDDSSSHGSSGVGNSYIVNLAKMLDIHEVRAELLSDTFSIHRECPLWCPHHVKQLPTSLNTHTD